MAESNEVKTARLEVKVEELTSQIVKIDAKVDAVLERLDKMAIVENELKDLKDEFKEHKKENDKRFDEFKKRNWVQNTLSAILGAVLSLLVAYAVNNIFK